MPDVFAASTSNVTLYDESAQRVGTSSNPLFATAFSALVPTQYNRIELVYTGSDVTQVIYLQAGVTVAALNLAYSGGLLSSVERV